MAMLTVIANAWGVPALRVTYRYRGPRDDMTILSATYYGPLGRRNAVAGELGEGCPLVVFIPLPEPWRWESFGSTRKSSGETQ
jgi:hypothetical protein